MNRKNISIACAGVSWLLFVAALVLPMRRGVGFGDGSLVDIPGWWVLVSSTLYAIPGVLRTVATFLGHLVTLKLTAIYDAHMFWLLGPVYRIA